MVLMALLCLEPTVMSEEKVELQVLLKEAWAVVLSLVLAAWLSAATVVLVVLVVMQMVVPEAQEVTQEQPMVQEFL